MSSQSSDRVLWRYAVAFEIDGNPVAGALLVTEQGVHLTAGRRGRPFELTIPRNELTRIRIGRKTSEQLNGYSTVVLERRGEPPFLVAPFGFGLLQEIADLLSSLSTESPVASERLELIVPLKRDRRDQVRRLVSTGPPFEPARLGLTRHEVYLDESEVRFAFEGPAVREALQSILSDASTWRAGLAWSRHIAAHPYLDEHPTPRRSGELIFSWRC